MRKRKLYLSELLKRCKRKNYEVYIHVDQDITLWNVTTRESIEALTETFYFDEEIKYWEVNSNKLEIWLK